MPIHKLLYLLQIVKYLMSKILRGEPSAIIDEVLLYYDKPTSANEEAADDGEKGEKSSQDK